MFDRVKLSAPMLILAGLLLAGFLLFYETPVVADQVTVSTPLGAYPGVVSASDLHVSWTSAVVGSNTFTITGSEILVIRNSLLHATGTIQYVSFESVATPYGRSGDILSYGIGPDDLVAFHFSDIVGWRNASSLAANVTADSANIEFCVLRY